MKANVVGELPKLGVAPTLKSSQLYRACA